MRSPPQSERVVTRLYLADYHLEAVRLSLAEGKKDQAREHLATAGEMIEEMGYGRRKGEVEDLGKQLTAEDAEDAEREGGDQ